MTKEITEPKPLVERLRDASVSKRVIVGYPPAWSDETQVIAPHALLREAADRIEELGRSRDEWFNGAQEQYRRIAALEEALRERENDWRVGDAATHEKETAYRGHCGICWNCRARALLARDNRALGGLPARWSASPLAGIHIGEDDSEDMT